MKSARHMFARPFALLHLLAQEGQAGLVVAGEDEDVVALAPAAPQADRAARGQPMLGDDPVEHRLGVGEQAARALADHLVVEDRGIIAGQLPGAEEGRPVDTVAQVARAASRRSCARPGCCGGGALPVGIAGEGVGARLVERRAARSGPCRRGPRGPAS